jgi:hypothetical protein
MGRMKDLHLEAEEIRDAYRFDDISFREATDKLVELGVFFGRNC